MHVSKKKQKKKWIIGGALIFSLIIFLSLQSLNNYSVYFYTPKEAVQKAYELHQKEIRVGGMVKVGSVKWQPKTLQVAFTLHDMKGTQMQVSYKGAPPDMFKEGSGVVVEGHIDQVGKSFKARNLLVKHSEEYKVPGDAKEDNYALLHKSIIKNEKT